MYLVEQLRSWNFKLGHQNSVRSLQENEMTSVLEIEDPIFNPVFITFFLEVVIISKYFFYSANSNETLTKNK